MVSYAWGAKKELVVGLAGALRGLGYDVWRDEEGSEIVPSMSGDTDERMAQAIESSHTVIVCVSPQYKVTTHNRNPNPNHTDLLPDLNPDTSSTYLNLAASLRPLST